MKFAVMRYNVRKGVGLVGDQLDVQSSFSVAFVDKVLQLLDFLRLNGLFCVLPHAMAGDDGFFKVIFTILVLCFWQAKVQSLCLISKKGGSYLIMVTL